MDTDPLTWSVAQVADFFRNHAASFLGDRPNLRLPDLDGFIQSLADNDVDGDILLKNVDNGSLREDIGVKSFGARNAVVHCIRKLQDLSKARQSTGPETIPQTPNSIVAASHPNNSEPEPVPAPVPGENVRAGETQVEDGKGKKRRKLDLSAVQTVEQVPQTKTKPEPTDDYMSGSKLPVDEIFYGNTAMNSEIGTLVPEANLLFLDPEKTERGYTLTHLDEEEKLWHREAYINYPQQEKNEGDSLYAYRRLRHALITEESKSVRRRGRDAIAILPYNENLLTDKKSRSATVYRLDENAEDGVIAVRENAAFLDAADVDYAVAGQEQGSDSGEWDFLTAKHRHQDGDELLPEYGQSENDDGMSSQMEREIEEEEEEVKQERGANLSREEAGNIIDDEINAMAENWKETKLPRKEEKQAYTVWRKMKQSMTIRSILIDSESDRIRHLNKRLAKQKDYILQTEWCKEKHVRDQCDSMSTTVEEREEAVWKIAVWNRKQEPPHTARHGQHSDGSKGKPGANASQRVIVHPTDRFSVSPAPVQDDDMDAEMERFHTPEGGEQGDAMAMDDGHSFDGGDEMEEADSPLADWVEPSPPALYGSPSSLPINSLQDVGQVSKTSSQIHQSGENDDDAESDFLPEMSVLLSQIPKPMRPRSSTPKKSTPSNSREQPIEISSDSHSTPASKRSRKKRMAGRKPNLLPTYPDDAKAAEIEAWTIRGLEEREDRRRLLLKLLSDAGEETRTTIVQYIMQLRVPGFKKVLKDTLSALRQDFTMGPTSQISETALLCTRLFLAYQTASAAVFEGKKTNNVSEQSWNGDGLDLYVSQLKSMLETSKYFKSLKTEPTSSAKSKIPAGTVISLLDDEDEEDDDSDPVQNTPSKKRINKKVHLSAKTKQSQAQASTRQDRFKQLQQQSSSQLQLEAMVEGDPSQSNVKVNILKDDDEDDVFVDSRIAKDMKRHQIAGVQFMWRELTAAGADEAQGCILAHEQGLGKTVQAIAVLVALNEASHSQNPRIHKQLPPRLRLTGVKDRQLRILIIVPAFLLENWRAELRKWAPKRLRNVFSAEASRPKEHEPILEQWFKIGGVMLMGQEAFQKKIVRREGKKVKLAAEGAIAEYLLNPGPDIVVADEAHRLANEKSLRSIAARQISTETRLALTGTPMSNDVQEIFGLVSFVAPDFLGDSDWFHAEYAKPIKEGNGKDSTANERRKALKKLAILHRDIEPKVDRADITVLEGSLPPKVEFVMKLPMTEMQHAAYSKYVQNLIAQDKTKDAAQVTLFGYLSVLTLLLNHPIAFKRKMHSPGKPTGKRRISEAPSETDSGAATPVPGQEGEAEDEQEQDEAADSIRTSGFSEEVIANITSHIGDDISANLSTKMAVLMQIVHRSKACGDKVLVFSQSIPSLDYLGELLQQSGVDFVRIDGQTKKRDDILKEMQDGKHDLLMCSTKAAGVGLNIQVANRVIILDSSFNPTHEKQAISRSFRLGQKKPVFVYRFTVGGTFEDMIYNKQLFKERLNKGVVDKITTKRIANTNLKFAIRQPADVEQEDLAESLGKDAVLDGIVDQEWEEAKRSEKDKIIVRSLTTMEVLQEKVADDQLNEEEQREVEMEFLVRRNPAFVAKGRKGGGAPNFGASRFSSSTAPAKGRQAQAGSAGPRTAHPNGINGLPTAHPPAPAPSQMGPPQPPVQSRVVRLPYGEQQPLRSTAPSIPHGLPMPPRQD